MAVDPAFQRWEWRGQRVGQIVLALAVLAALAGFFGGGPVASARRVSSDGTLAVTYERFARRGAHTRLRVEVSGAGEGEHRLRLSRTYTGAVEVRQMTPAPGEVALTPQGTEMIFDFDQGGAVEFDIWPGRAGRLDAEVMLDDRARLTFWQWVWFWSFAWSPSCAPSRFISSC